MKVKRRTKLKMPLKKIPKRKQNGLRQSIDSSQDLGTLEYPPNVSALIVSSVQNQNDSFVQEYYYDVQRSTGWDEGNLDPGASTETASTSRQADRKTVRPPPLVSIARTSAAPQVPSSGTTPKFPRLNPGSTEVPNRMCGYTPNDDLTADNRKSISAQGPTSSQKNVFNFTDAKENIDRGCENLDGYSKPLHPSQIKNENVEQFPFPEPKPFRTGGPLKAQSNYRLPSRHDHLEPGDAYASRMSSKAKSSVRPYEQYPHDVRIPLVNVRPPLMAPISPERKCRDRVKTTSAAANKSSDESVYFNRGNGSARGQRPVESNQFCKFEVPGRKSPGYRNPRIRCGQGARPEQVSAGDDDDVVITGVVSLNCGESNCGKRRGGKRAADVQRDGDYYNNFYNECVPKKKLTKRSYVKKSARNLMTSQDGKKRCDHQVVWDFDPRSLDAKDDINGLRCVASAAMSKAGFRLADPERNVRRKSKSKCDKSVTLGDEEVERLRNAHFSTIIDAIKKEDDLMKSCLKSQEEVDWRSWLNYVDPRSEVLEGSGTDSGNEDELLLMRDLSEFLLLSEDRRNAPERSTDKPREINFDSIDSSVSYINSIGTTLSIPLNDDINDLKIPTIDDGENYDDNPFYSRWQSRFDNYPKYPVQQRLKNRSDNYWKRYLLSDHNPFISDTGRYVFAPVLPDKEKRLDEFAAKAGLILRSESAERGLAPSYESKFYRKRIYRKRSKILDDLIVLH